MRKIYEDSGLNFKEKIMEPKTFEAAMTRVLTDFVSDDTLVEVRDVINSQTEADDFAKALRNACDIVLSTREDDESRN